MVRKERLEMIVTSIGLEEKTYQDLSELVFKVESRGQLLMPIYIAQWKRYEKT